MRDIPNVAGSLKKISHFIGDRKPVHFERCVWHYADLSIFSFVNASNVLSEYTLGVHNDLSFYPQTLLCHWRLWAEALKIWIACPGKLKIEFQFSDEVDLWALRDRKHVFVSIGA
jgi:hypothetical protein